MDLIEEAPVLLVLVVIVIIVAALFGITDVIGATRNVTLQRPVITAFGEAVALATNDLGGEYEYIITLNTKMVMNPKVAMELVPVITYKKEHAKAEFQPVGEMFTVDQCEGGCVFLARITSKIPPISRTSAQLLSFVEGQEYVLETPERGVYKIGLDYMYYDKKVCRADFFVECKDDIKFFDDMRACKDNEPANIECTRNVPDLCKGSVTIDLKDVSSGGSAVLDCTGGRAENVELEIVGGEAWEPKDNVLLTVFNLTPCVQPKTAKEWMTACQEDMLLDRHKIEFNP